MKQLVILIVVASSVFAGAQRSAQPRTGEIKGTVTDQNGSAVSAATVFAVPQGLAFDDIAPRSVKTDSNGRFDFRGGFSLEPYKIYSQKEEDSYPDPLDRFYADDKAAPQVELTRNHPSAIVTVQLGPRAAVLTGRVIDADTGADTKASLFFLDQEGNGHRVLVDGSFRTLLPAGKPVTVMVAAEAPPYRTQRPIAPLQLEPGQYVYMEIPVSRQ